MFLFRKLSRKADELLELKSRMKKQQQQSLTLSYGYRLLQTASGSRSISTCNNTKQLDTSSIVNLDENCIFPLTDNQIGKGRFGTCSVVMLHEYKACMKTLEKSVDIAHVLREAYFIMEAGGHKSIPHLFGIIKSLRSIVMSYHSVEGEHLSMYDACFRCDSMEQFHCAKWKPYMIAAAQVLSHLKSRKILHNDIKLDNFVFGTHQSSSILPILVDFGKACYLEHGKKYELVSDEIETYKLHHPHIAPDLRDGKCRQSYSSDVYSFGYMLYMLTKRVRMDAPVHSSLRAIATECMHYRENSRPEIEDVVHLLMN